MESQADIAYIYKVDPRKPKGRWTLVTLIPKTFAAKGSSCERRVCVQAPASRMLPSTRSKGRFLRAHTNVSCAYCLQISRIFNQLTCLTPRNHFCPMLHTALAPSRLTFADGTTLDQLKKRWLCRGEVVTQLWKFLGCSGRDSWP